ncbi:sugar-transfer associated ATP-grasp domain-containing protein [Microbacterium elymi]|uniref:Flagellar biosynthesis protein n=1 Tax=Microbacterium elymi TaxID=2909587 RepID=A0ABY5NJL4_9MICO|nr:sugar-transfer associated ATP-grasp domain-containing protein [Microbacterium elymi]UUT35362.1 flagellar biosynthesis protein [Microbacterium elymi]
MKIDLSARVNYLLGRVRRFQPSRVTGLARQIAREQGKWTPAVAADMLWAAAFHDTAFIDYYEADFAALNRRERKTFMTSLIQHHIAKRLNDPEAAEVFADKRRFHRRFAEFTGREWLDLEEAGPDQLAEFAARHPVLIAKEPVSREGHGVFRYQAADVTDWPSFHAELVAKGQVLVEEAIVQHPYLAAYCAGTVNTTRLVSYFDGTHVHIVSRVQKFGRGAVSDQFTWGGFFTMLDHDGRAVGIGHSGKSNTFYPVHPDSGASIPDFRVPRWDEVVALIDAAARVVPEVPYVGWDVAVGPDGPLLIEGNWIPGLYETRVTATGIRTGSRPEHEAVMTW